MQNLQCKVCDSLPAHIHKILDVSSIQYSVSVIGEFPGE